MASFHIKGLDIRNILKAALCFCLFSSPSFSQSVSILYDTDGYVGDESALAGSASPAGIAVQPVTRSGVTPNIGADSFNSRDWSLTGSPGSTYLFWDLDLGSGVYSITDMDIGFRRSSTGPSDIILEFRPGATGPWVQILNISGINQTSARRTGSGGVPAINVLPLQNLTGIVEFRMFGGNAGTPLGTLRLTGSSGREAIRIFLDPVNPANLETSKTVRVGPADILECMDPGTMAPPASTLPMRPGSCVEYLIEVSNTGGAAATGIILQDIMPPDLIFLLHVRSGWIETNPGFLVIEPLSGTDCFVDTCLFRIENAEISSGGTANIRIRSLLR